MMTSRPCCSAGRNGSGGAGMTLAMVDSPSGAASARAMKPAITSGVAGSSSRPPTIVETSCSRNWNRVATPKLPPPPRIAQNSSGWRLVVDVEQLAVGGHQLGGQQLVDRQAVLSDQVADAAAEGEPADPDRAGVAEPGRQPVGAGGGGVLAGRQPRLGPGGALLGVDLQGVHVGQVEHDAAVGGAVPGQAVAAAANRQLQPGLACQRHHLGHVAGVGGPDDDRRPAVDAAVEHGPRLIVGGVAGGDDPTIDSGTKPPPDRDHGGVGGQQRHGQLLIRCHVGHAMEPPQVEASPEGGNGVGTCGHSAAPTGTPTGERTGSTG